MSGSIRIYLLFLFISFFFLLFSLIILKSTEKPKTALKILEENITALKGGDRHIKNPCYCKTNTLVDPHEIQEIKIYNI